MGVLEKTKHVSLYQVPIFKIGITDLFDLFTFIFYADYKHFRAGIPLNCVYVVPGSTSALFLPLGTFVKRILIFSHLA